MNIKYRHKATTFNKARIAILHFFGLFKTSQHIDNVTLLLQTTANEADISERFSRDKETDDDVRQFKAHILDEFKRNPKMEERCKSCKQIWVVLYDHDNNEFRGGRMKMLHYDSTGVLFYPYQPDRDAFKRDQLLETALNE